MKQAQFEISYYDRPVYVITSPKGAGRWTLKDEFPNVAAAVAAIEVTGLGVTDGLQPTTTTIAAANTSTLDRLSSIFTSELLQCCLMDASRTCPWLGPK